ncbi:hypothetical protein [Sphingomonas sp. TREG-RG-20F-R18-01]|uniref:hypothetical protein n=1 Tax=Sphingomonas sp. TREG-RG-20F-R18-01 TaxID=2914982 RepID=UPI001F580F93
MTDLPPPSDPVATPAEKAEAAAIRRRWVSLAEIVSVAGVAIAGLGLWLTWSDHRSEQAEKQTQSVTESREHARYVVKASVARNGDILIERDDRHPLGDVAVVFPAALGIPAQTSPTQTISRSWYERALLAATDGGDDRKAGKLPVLLTVHYWNDDAPRTVSGIYDIVWATKGRLLFGRELKTEALRLRTPAATKAALEAAWAIERPKG